MACLEFAGRRAQNRAMRKILACSVLLLTALPAVAADTARVSGNPPVRSGPGSQYDITGRLPAGATVGLQYCTSDDGWCLVTGAGWVRSSFLVGWSAKIPVTPQQLLVDPFGSNDHRDDDDADDDGLSW